MRKVRLRLIMQYMSKARLLHAQVLYLLCKLSLHVNTFSYSQYALSTMYLLILTRWVRSPSYILPLTFYNSFIDRYAAC